MRRKTWAIPVGILAVAAVAVVVWCIFLPRPQIRPGPTPGPVMRAPAVTTALAPAQPASVARADDASLVR